jgi:holo-[acyl-carrier protein] synthase
MLTPENWRLQVIVGIGIDLLENRRVEEELKRGEWLASEGVFLPSELEQANSCSRPALHLAECFTGKEAALKALGVGIGNIGCFREIEVFLGKTIEPWLMFHGKVKHQADQMGIRRIRLSITRTAKLTGALVILES